jgi:CRP-like cAMP-binding protein
MKKEFTKTLEGLNEFISSAKGMDDLKKLSENREIKTYRKKEIIYEEGTFPRGIYFVNRGKVKTFKTHELGKEFITGLYKEGDFFGYLALMEESKYSDSSEALEESEVCFIPKEDFISLIFKNSEVSRKFMKMLSDNLSDKEEQLLKLAYNSVRKRVAEALVTLNNRYKKDSEPRFSMNISREDIANLAGTATETTIRTLSDFKDEKLIDIKGGTIAIMDYDKLSHLRN